MSNTVAEETTSPETAILSEIREAEKKADEIVERAKLQKDSIIQEAKTNASKIILAKEEELRKTQEKKIMEFRNKSRLLSEEKLAEGKSLAKQIKAISEKNIPKAVNFVLKKFEEMI